MLTLSQGFFTVPCGLPVSRCTRSQEGIWPGQRAELAKGMFHIIEHHAQYIGWGEFAGRGQSLLGDGAGHLSIGGEYGIVHHLVFLWVF